MMNLESPVQYLKGVGPRKAELLKKLGVETLKDLLYLSPRRWLDRSVIKPIGSVRNGETVTVVGEVLDAWVETTKGGKKIGTVVIWDGTGALTGRWFNQDWVEKVFKKHLKVVFSGEISFFKGFQILNPEYEILESDDYELVHTGRIVPLYPLTAGLNQKFMSSRNCEGIDIPVHRRKGKRFYPASDCAGDCLHCTDPKCGIPDLAMGRPGSKKDWKLSDYRRWSAQLKMGDLFYGSDSEEG